MAFAVDDDGRVQPALRDLLRPDLLTRARLVSGDRAVTRSEDYEPLPLDHRDDRRVLRRVDGDAAGAVHPVQLTGRFVERVNAVLPAGLIPPAERDAAEKHLVFIDARGRRASA